MQVIKPLSIGVLSRPFEFRREFCLGIATLCFVPIGDRPGLLKEQAMWPFLAKALPGQAVDAAIPKRHGEFLVAATGHAPDGEAVTRLRVGALLGRRRKMLSLVGHRRWDGRQASAPEPFTTMKVDWKHAFGGEGCDDNPLGLGAGAETATPEAPVDLPTVLPNTPELQAFRTPVGFGPVDQTWPARARLAGTHDDAWLKQDFPGFARDIDWRFFNIAPADQQFDGALVGDEPYAFENLHPTQPLIKGVLPGIQPRAFIDRDTDSGFVEIPLALTTVWFFPDALCLVLVHHGTAAVRHELAADVARLVIGADRIGAPRDAGHFRTIMEQRLDEERGAMLALRDNDLVPEEFLLPDPEEDAEDEAGASESLHWPRARRRQELEHADLRAKLREQGLDPDKYDLPEPFLPAEPPSPTKLEDLPDLVAKMEADAEHQIQEAEALLAEAKQKAEAAMRKAGKSEEEIAEMLTVEGQTSGGPPDFSAAGMRQQLTDAAAQLRARGLDDSKISAQLNDPETQAEWEESERSLADMYVASAQYQDPAPPLDAEASQAWRAALLGNDGRSWHRADLCGADLAGIDLSGRDLSGIWLDGADLVGANFSNAILKGAVLAHARLEGSRFDGADLSDANLGGASLRGASLAKATMRETVLATADLTDGDLRGADLTEADLMEAVLQGARFDGAKAPDWNVLNMALPGLNAPGMMLEGANFIEADLSGANFAGANLHRVAFVGCNLAGANFERATLTKCCFVSDCDCTGANFSHADMASANLRETRLQSANLSHAEMPGADLSEADLTGALLIGTNAIGARFADAVLSRAMLRGANLKQGDLARADLRSADMRDVGAYEANLSRALIDGVTQVSGMQRTRMRYLPLAERQ